MDLADHSLQLVSTLIVRSYIELKTVTSSMSRTHSTTKKIITLRTVPPK